MALSKFSASEIKGQSGAIVSIDSRTDSQRGKRKRRDTHQVSEGARNEITAAYPRWSPSSEFVANRSGVTRAAVVDFKMAELERRIQQLERSARRAA